MFADNWKWSRSVQPAAHLNNCDRYNAHLRQMSSLRYSVAAQSMNTSSAVITFPVCGSVMFSCCKRVIHAGQVILGIVRESFCRILTEAVKEVCEIEEALSIVRRKIWGVHYPPRYSIADRGFEHKTNLLRRHHSHSKMRQPLQNLRSSRRHHFDPMDSGSYARTHVPAWRMYIDLRESALVPSTYVSCALEYSFTCGLYESDEIEIAARYYVRCCWHKGHRCAGRRPRRGSPHCRRIPGRWDRSCSSNVSINAFISPSFTCVPSSAQK